MQNVKHELNADYRQTRQIDWTACSN